MWLHSGTPSRTGYNFSYWSCSGGGNYSPGQQYLPDPGGTITMTAQWTKKTWTVSYDANGGENAPGSQTKTYGDTLVLSSTKPFKADYNFVGWNTKADGSGTSYASGGNYTANAAVILYAQWELAYVRPRLSNVKIGRCDTSGNWSDSGTKIRCDFNYATDMTGVYAKLQYKATTATSWSTASSNILSNSSTKSGTISKKNFSETFSTESSYIARIYIYDSKGTNYATYSSEFSISTQSYPIDVRREGKGVAFGKVAEKDNAVEIGFKDLYLNNKRIQDLIYPVRKYIYEYEFSESFYFIWWYMETNSQRTLLGW